MTKEVLKLALEALETCGDDEWHTDDDFGMMQTYDADKVNQAITAIKEALAQPVQEPRPWMGLSNGEMVEFSEMELGSWDLILEVEAKLKEKNFD